jgi:formylglycine-generating enzyme required for sulfatase activity
MFRHLCTATLTALAALGSLAPTLSIPGCNNQSGTSKPDSKREETGAGGKAVGGTTSNFPRELAVDLGGGVKLEMVLIPAGEYRMGSPDSDSQAGREQKPQHPVRITKPFYLGKYLVTQQQWESLMGSNPARFKGPKNPAVWVGWEHCQAFLQRLNANSGGRGGKFVLPSEAQWEYACRAGTNTRYGFGDDEKKLGDYAWYKANSGDKTHPVGEKKPNAWGLFDMHGNAWEWCQDWWDGGYYAKSPADDPAGPAGGAYHVFRGGGCTNPAQSCRSAFRGGALPSYRDDRLGLRLCLLPADKVGTLVVATPEKPRPAAGKTKSLSKELTIDLRSGIQLELVLIPPGEFRMGSTEEDEGATPQHRVRITKPFYFGRYPVTQEQWEAVMGANPSNFKGAMNPVDQVTWIQCQDFLGKLGAMPGRPTGKFALPTEAQWEYACRAGSSSRYYCGNDEKQLGECAWYMGNSGNKTHTVGEKNPNAWGLFDMHGNVWEWCQDWYDEGYYVTSPADDPTGPSRGSFRACRGGGWYDVPKRCRDAARNPKEPGERSLDVGFRVVLLPPDP